MYEIIKNVIDSSRYELSDMLKKIDTIWLQGDITDEEKNTLVELSRNNANSENSYEPLRRQIEKLFELMTQNENEHAEFNKKIAKLEGGEIPSPEPGEEYPEYKQPTGAHDAYHKDDKVTYNGNRYICIAPEGVAVVWNPDTYPAYWKKV